MISLSYHAKSAHKVGVGHLAAGPRGGVEEPHARAGPPARAEARTAVLVERSQKARPCRSGTRAREGALAVVTHGVSYHVLPCGDPPLLAHGFPEARLRLRLPFRDRRCKVVLE